MYRRCFLRPSPPFLPIQPLRSSVFQSRSPGYNSSVFNSSVNARYQLFNSSSTKLFTPPPETPLNSSVHSTQQQQDNAISAYSLVNPPESTRPAPLDVPERGPDDSAFGYYFKLGKGYLSFYKTGLKNVYHNFTKARPLEATIAKAGSITDLTEQNGINRAEFQLVWRSRHDSARIPFFVLMFIVCGEFTPLLVLYFSRIVPLNCRIPKQLNYERAKLEARRAQSFETLKQLQLKSPQKVPNLKLRINAVKLEDLTKDEVLHCSRSLGLHGGLLPEAVWPPTRWLRYKVWRRLEYLDIDDKLLMRAGGPSLIASGEELKMALCDRGLDVLNKSEAELRDDLRKWFRAREVMQGIGPGFFLNRPPKATQN